MKNNWPIPDLIHDFTEWKYGLNLVVELGKPSTYVYGPVMLTKFRSTKNITLLFIESILKKESLWYYLRVNDYSINGGKQSCYAF